ncbi:MAG: transposase [Planctomycetes bacterium]|nr:transposase [Planctomycetota bacterium]
MTECTRTPLRFSSVGRKKIVADFTGGDLTSDGGLVLLREVDRRIGLVDALNAAVRDPRDPDRIEHDQRTLLAQRLFALAAGYEDLNDHAGLRTDPLWQTLADRRLKPGRVPCFRAVRESMLRTARAGKQPMAHGFARPAVTARP